MAKMADQFNEGLDGPDQKLREILLKRQMGQQLSDKEVRRLAQRQHVEEVHGINKANEQGRFSERSIYGFGQERADAAQEREMQQLARELAARNEARGFDPNLAGRMQEEEYDNLRLRGRVMRQQVDGNRMTMEEQRRQQELEQQRRDIFNRMLEDPQTPDDLKQLLRNAQALTPGGVPDTGSVRDTQRITFMPDTKNVNGTRLVEVSPGNYIPDPQQARPPRQRAEPSGTGVKGIDQLDSLLANGRITPEQHERGVKKLLIEMGAEDAPEAIDTEVPEDPFAAAANNLNAS